MGCVHVFQKTLRALIISISANKTFRKENNENLVGGGGLGAGEGSEIIKVVRIRHCYQIRSTGWERCRGGLSTAGKLITVADELSRAHEEGTWVTDRPLQTVRL